MLSASSGPTHSSEHSDAQLVMHPCVQYDRILYTYIEVVTCIRAFLLWAEALMLWVIICPLSRSK